MTQQLVFSQLVANLSLAQLKVTMPYIMTSDRAYEMEFMNSTYQSGSTVNIRKMNRYIAQRGRILPPQNTIEEIVPITIGDSYGLSVAFNTVELTLEMTKQAELYHQRYTSPIVETLAGNLEIDIAKAAETQVNYFAGSPTAQFSDFQLVDLVNAQMQELGMPREDDVNMVLHARDASALKASNQNAFNPTLNTDISFKSQLGRYSRFQLFESGNVITHVAGTFPGAPVVNGAVGSGNTIVMSGFTASQTNVLTAGDLITFGVSGTPTAVYSMHPITHLSTGQLMSFVVQPSTLPSGNYNSDAGGNVTVTVSPAIISDPTDPRINVSQIIPNGVQVNCVGAGLTYRLGTAYAARGLSLVMPPMVRVAAPECGLAKDEQTGIALRITRAWDQINGLDSTRVEFLAGFRWFDQYAIKIVSAL